MNWAYVLGLLAVSAAGIVQYFINREMRQRLDRLKKAPAFIAKGVAEQLTSSLAQPRRTDGDLAERRARLDVLLEMLPGESEADAGQRIAAETEKFRRAYLAEVRKDLRGLSRDLQAKGLTVVETAQLLEAECDDFPRQEILRLVTETFEQVSATSQSAPSPSVTGHE